MYLEEGASAFFVKAVLPSAIAVAYYYFLQPCFNLIKSTIISFHSKRKSKKNKTLSSTLKVHLRAILIVVHIIVSCEHLKIILGRRLTELPLVTLHLNAISRRLYKKKFFPSAELNKLRIESNQTKYRLQKKLNDDDSLFFPHHSKFDFFFFCVFFGGGREEESCILFPIS